MGKHKVWKNIYLGKISIGKMYIYGKCLWENIYLLKISMGKCIFKENFYGKIYIYGKYLSEKYIFIENIYGKMYIYGKYLWENVYLWKISMGKCIFREKSKLVSPSSFRRTLLEKQIINYFCFDQNNSVESEQKRIWISSTFHLFKKQSKPGVGC